MDETQKLKEEVMQVINSEEIGEYFRNKLRGCKILDINDTFKFSCKQCGKCCHNIDDIMVFPYDIYRISKFFNQKPALILEKHFKVHIGPDSKLPVVTLKLRSYDKSCPFLRNRRCEIHEVKPVVCSLYPLGRIMLPRTQQVIYTLQDIPCSSNNGDICSVKEWLDLFSNIENEVYSKYYSEFTANFINNSKTYFKLCQMLSEEILNQLQECILLLLYCNYKTSMDFKAQFNKNTNKVLELVNYTWDLLEKCKSKGIKL